MKKKTRRVDSNKAPTTRQPADNAAKAVPAEAVIRPHPLQMNENELRWTHLCADRWFCFAEHGNPPVGLVVQVAVWVNDRVLYTAVGRKTDKLIEGGTQEAWEVMSSFPQVSQRLTHWRFLSGPPELCNKRPGAESEA